MNNDKTFWVTGASRGIGLSIVENLLDNGARCIVSARNSTEFVTLTNGLRDKYGSQKVLFMPFDASNFDSLKMAFKEIIKSVKKIDGFVGNAGIMEDAPLGMITPDLLMHQYQVNVTSTILAMQFASRLIEKNGSGSIVLMSSIIGSHGFSGQVAYSSSKSALIGVGKSASKELAKKNIRVNIVTPGFIETNLTSRINDQSRSKILSSIGMNRFGNANEVADLVNFLLSEKSSYITGQTIGIDGGMIL